MKTKQVFTPKQNTLIGFKKARSLVDTIIKMVEEDRYCIDIMQQNLAVMGLLKSAQESLMNNHLETCFADGIKSGNRNKQKEMIEEIESVVKMGNK
jgi:CsoR family transcriptional regulator, copper-sensing transcriptional repressor